MPTTVQLAYGTFAILGVISVFIYNFANSTSILRNNSNRNPDFIYLQRKFFLVYFLALLGDWLQGPYVYALYKEYGFEESEISILYLIGFASSIIFGTITGSLADNYGRKLLCMIFSILYSLCCITKLSDDYYILALGRVLGGISTSILFSCFESWYVNEHIEKYNFQLDWISVTFSIATYCNGILAILAGVIANFVAETLEYGAVGPFIISIPVLLASGIIALTTWNENTGTNTNIISIKTLSNQFKEALNIILNNSEILSLGIIQSCFESVMYIFVFLWTPVLEPMNPPIGIIFSCFMIAVMIGSSLYTLLLNKNIQSDKILLISCILVCLSTFLCVFTNAFYSFILFLILELAVGLYFPAICSLRSEILPETHRANIINWFRVPMNILTCSGLIWLHFHIKYKFNYSDQKLFAYCSCIMIVSIIYCYQFTRNRKLNTTIKNINNEQSEKLINDDNNKNENV